MKKLNRKKTIICACIAIPVTLATIFIGKAVKAAKRRKYSTTSY